MRQAWPICRLARFSFGSAFRSLGASGCAARLLTALRGCAASAQVGRGDEEEALRARPPAFALDAGSFRWRDREALPARLADVRASLLHSIGTCSFFEPVEELEQLGILG